MEIKTSQLLRYPGGKYRARKILYQHMPKDVDFVVSPFIGGASFEMFLNQKGIQVKGYDISYLLVNFWQTVLTKPEELADFLNNNKDIDKEKFYEIQNELIDLKNKEINNKNVELAGKYYIINRCSFSGSTLSGGFSKESSTQRYNERSIQRVREYKNPLLHVEQGDFFDIISSSQNDFLFLDPPYALEDNKNKLYGVHGNFHKNFDHKRLYKIMKDYKGKFLLTYNNSDFIQKLWRDFNIVETSWKYGMNKNKKSSEIIIKNY